MSSLDGVERLFYKKKRKLIPIFYQSRAVHIRASDLCPRELSISGVPSSARESTIWWGFSHWDWDTSILGRWRMDWKLGLFYIPCVASKADYVLLDGSKVERISSEDVSCRHGFPEEWTIRWPLENEPEAESLLPMVGSIYFHSFTHLRVRYAYHAPHQTFIPSTYREILTKKPPSSREDARLIYGNNSSEVQVPSILHLLLTEVLHPFYVFQIASIILWSLDEYMFYAGCIFIISALSILLSLLETRRQSKALREMTRFQPKNDELDPVHLVPGDVLVIKDNQVLPCDAVIISGSVLVNESMLTGESTKHRVHTLYCGTKVLQTRNHLGPENPVEAIVVRTGFSTAKGELKMVWDFDGVVSCGSNDSKKWASVDEVTDPEVVWCLATCHSLTLINGELAGDPLDVKMFEATGWLIKPKNSAFVESQFDEKCSNPRYLGIWYYAIISIQLRSGTNVRYIPLGFHENLKALTLKGYRVIALSTKELHDTKWHKIQKLKREYVESELKFLGFLVMRNNLKSESKPVIDLLTEADIRCVMVTGDNILTAISVARECGLIGPSDDVMRVEATPDKLEITPTLLNESNERSTSDGNNVIIDTVKGTVFARMDPEQKAQLIEEAIKIDYVVGMCGDGANDCSALKAAHVGISLSEAEASVAAPFTSAIQNITCVPTVIQEGRCSLVTSFGLFKYMALYSIVQFISVLTLYSVNSNLGDTQFLYIDLIITTTVAVLMSWTRPYPKIERKRPTGSLISGTNLFSIVSQIFVCLGVQIGAYFYLLRNNWYHPVIPNPDDEEVLCWETTTIFFVSSYQYLILAAAFSKAFVVLNYVLSFFIEKVMAESFLVKKLSHKLTGKTAPKNAFKRIRSSIEEEDWPCFEGLEVKASAQEEGLRSPGFTDNITNEYGLEVIFTGDSWTKSTLCVSRFTKRTAKKKTYF
ncbi:ATP13A2 [Lepeophtheirus salmonis]|uniref:ATP13A2 n=1 Tax=Lepeophtheirus salmonis TaxID=72036 RepID=A0A7R8H3J7_LEPSM|nr:ATP13A2 [Lepeophtheirus salmonis]CAF2845182.1 ATP13A2 [Lepeophtheirus salmonis]